ncbi:MAG TPA: 23S rRNA (pseudouridine(1915)-N(3))-methyltransferase RlmH [Rhodocyclaceae bacterium]|jgi:23S rRNA (pseudouridine1915-N3)-methyltransferase|nr:23S rRNA (pseudouridine(1915)-N(3))-methyltransferase RlmH [Rhodocyclaceae bacterium]
MKLIIVAVGTRMPDWVETAYADFAKRMPRECALELREIKAEPRTTGKSVDAMMAAEATRIRAALPARCRRIILDERGTEATTKLWAERLGEWMGGGEDVAFMIGGPDGLSPEIKAEADERYRISGLTLPHAMVRVMLAEALYRAHSLHKGHPYHRE